MCLLELSEVWWNMVFTASICVSSRTVRGVVEHGVQVFVCLLELSEVWWNMVFTASICVSSRTVGGVVEHGVHCKYLCVF